MAIVTLTANETGANSLTDINANFADLDTTKADLASPTFSGTPSLPTGTTAVTQSANDNSTKLATTAYVDAQAALNEPTKEIWIPLQSRGGGEPNTFEISTGIYWGNSIGVGDTLGIGFVIPHDFVSLVSLVAAVYPDATETVQWDCTVRFGAVGEALTNTTGTDSNRTQAVTTTVFQELNLNQGNVATATAGFAAGDYVNVQITSDITQIRILGLRFRYT